MENKQNISNRQAVLMTASDTRNTVKGNGDNFKSVENLTDGYNSIEEAMNKLKENNKESGELLILFDAHGKHKDGISYIIFNETNEKNSSKDIPVKDFYNNIKKIKEKTQFTGYIHVVHSQCQMGGIKKNVENFDDLSIGFMSSRKDPAYSSDTNTIFQITLDAFLNNQEYIINIIIKSLALGIRFDILTPTSEKEQYIYSKNKFTLKDIHDIASALDKLSIDESNEEEVINNVQKIIQNKFNNFLKRIITKEKINSELNVLDIIKEKISSINNIKSLLLKTYFRALKLNLERNNSEIKLRKDFNNELDKDQSIEKHNINSNILEQEFMKHDINNSINNILEVKLNEIKHLNQILKIPLNLNSMNTIPLIKNLCLIFNDEKKAKVLTNILHNILNTSHIKYDTFKKIIEQYAKLDNKDANIKYDTKKIILLLSPNNFLDSSYHEELIKNYTKIHYSYINDIIKNNLYPNLKPENIKYLAQIGNKYHDNDYSKKYFQHINAMADKIEDKSKISELNEYYEYIMQKSSYNIDIDTYIKIINNFTIKDLKQIPKEMFVTLMQNENEKDKDKNLVTDAFLMLNPYPNAIAKLIALYKNDKPDKKKFIKTLKKISKKNIQNNKSQKKATQKTTFEDNINCILDKSIDGKEIKCNIF